MWFYLYKWRFRNERHSSSLRNWKQLLPGNGSKVLFFFKYLTWFTFKIVTDMSTSPATVTASCATYCPSSTSSLNSICYIGSNSNKIGFYCFVGDLYSSGQGGSPIMCNSGYYCQVN